MLVSDDPLSDKRSLKKLNTDRTSLFLMSCFI